MQGNFIRIDPCKCQTQPVPLSWISPKWGIVELYKFHLPFLSFSRFLLLPRDVPQWGEHFLEGVSLTFKNLSLIAYIVQRLKQKLKKYLVKKHEFLQKLYYCILLVNVQFISRSSVVPQETRSLMITVVWCNLLSRCYIPPLDLVSILSVMSKQIPIPIFLTDKSILIKTYFFNYL